MVWFGEPIAAAAIRAAEDATACDLLISIGTSNVVYPAAGLVGQARARGAFPVEITRKLRGAGRI